MEQGAEGLEVSRRSRGTNHQWQSFFGDFRLTPPTSSHTILCDGDLKQVSMLPLPPLLESLS